MESNLNGLYKISFDIEIEANDALSISDLAQSLTEGILSEELAAKVSHLTMEKIEKHGKTEPKVLKVGDKVQVLSDLNLDAEIYHDDGYVFIGNPSDISERVVTESVSITVEAGSIGYVNKINKDGSLEIVDMDKPYVNTLWQEIGIDVVNIDLITVTADQIEKIDTDEVK